MSDFRPVRPGKWLWSLEVLEITSGSCGKYWKSSLSEPVHSPAESLDCLALYKCFISLLHAPSFTQVVVFCALVLFNSCCLPVTFTKIVWGSWKVLKKYWTVRTAIQWEPWINHAINYYEILMIKINLVVKFRKKVKPLSKAILTTL